MIEIRDRIVGLERVRARDLREHPLNPRKHPDGQKSAVSLLLREIGMADRLLAFRDSEGKLRLVDGHLRRDLLGDTEVAVLVTDLTEEEAALMVAVGDPLAGLAERDDAVMAELLLQTDSDLLAQLLDGNDALAAALGHPGRGLRPGANPDAIPEEVEARCRPGDLWALGEHRLLCGDSTNAEDVARLLDGAQVAACVTDPPYNVGLDYDQATDDAKDAGGYDSFTRGWWDLVSCKARIVTPGVANLGYWLTHLKPQAVGVWTKLNSMTRASASRFNCWEPLVFFDFDCWEPIAFYGCKNTSRAHDVFNFPTSVHFGGAGSGIADPHPCPKPASLWQELMQRYTPEGAVIYEPFCGSGTGIVSAELAARNVRAMEHSAHYCDIAIARFEQATGKRAERLEAA